MLVVPPIFKDPGHFERYMRRKTIALAVCFGLTVIVLTVVVVALRPMF